jgi:hypothetical protein
MAGGVEHEEGKSRREILKTLGAAAAGAVAGGVLRSDEAQAGHGVINATSNSVDKPAIHAENTAEFGPGVVIDTVLGTGLRVNGSPGISASGGERSAIIAGGGDGHGVEAYAIETSAVSGRSEQYQGIDGEGQDGVTGRSLEIYGPGNGVFGYAPTGSGVKGSSQSGVGVHATAPRDTGTALQVEGRARFSTASAGTVSAGQDSAAVSDPTVTNGSHVTVTLTGDPGQASSSPGTKPVVVWVERQPGTGFVVHMSRPVRFATPFTYLIVEPV